jgi:hypothetical protein
MRAGNLQRRNHCAGRGVARNQKERGTGWNASRQHHNQWLF